MASKSPADYGKLMKSSYKNAKSYGVGFGGENKSMSIAKSDFPNNPKGAGMKVKQSISNAVTGKKSFFNSKGTAKNSFGKKSY